MSVEGAIIAQAHPAMLAARLNVGIHHEIRKGCTPDLSNEPVELEPFFQPLMGADTLPPGDRPFEAVPLTLKSPPDFLRQQVWISPAQEFDWLRSELFLKQLTGVSQRVGLEISGNHRQLTIAVLCVKQDLPVLSAAFEGTFADCRLAKPEQGFLANLPSEAWNDVVFSDHYPRPPYSHLLTRPDELHVSPYEPLITALATIPPPAVGIYQALFQPVAPDHDWHRNVQILLDLEYTIKLMSGLQVPQRYAQQAPSGDLRQMSGQLETKAHNDKAFFCVALRIAVVGAGPTGHDLLRSVSTFCSLFQHGCRPLCRLTETDYARRLSAGGYRDLFLLGLTFRPGFLVNSWELAGPVHIPPTGIIESRRITLPTLGTLLVQGDTLTSGTPVGTCPIPGKPRLICIPEAIRICHTHVIGKPRMGKSNLLEGMILGDIDGGHGVAVLDPHGDLVKRVLCLLPEDCIERTIYFDPGDPEYVAIWNPMWLGPGQDIARTTANLVAAFKSFFEGWGHRLEHLLRYSIFALLHLPGSTLQDVSILLRKNSEPGKKLQRRLLEQVEDGASRRFLESDLKNYRSGDFEPVHHKLSTLLAGGPVTRMLSQPDSSFDLRRIMDDGMVLLIDLSSIDTVNRDVLGCLLLSLLHSAALTRSDLPAADRRPFHVYCDEAHRFLTDALEDLIAETRKFGVSLTLAHQFLSQFPQKKADALAAVGSTIIFNVNEQDAGYLLKGLRNQVQIEELTSLPPWEAILRCNTEIVRIRTLPPAEIKDDNCRDRILAESRRRYYKPIDQFRTASRPRFRPDRVDASPATGPTVAGRGPGEFVYDDGF